MSGSPLVAVVQMQSGNVLEHNLQRAGQLMDEAADRGARLLVLPENFSFMGATLEEKRGHQEDPVNGPSLGFLKTFAKRRGVWIVGGSVALATDDPQLATNTSFLVGDDGEVKARYDKIHLFDVNLGNGEAHRESSLVRPGCTPVVVDTPFGRLGLSICYDLRFPELYRALSREGAEILAIPSAFTLTTGKDHWDLLVRTRAVENFCYVLAAGQWGKHPGRRRTYGHSVIVEPWGAVVAHCPDGEGIALAPLDLKRVKSCRDLIPCLGHRVI